MNLLSKEYLDRLLAPKAIDPCWVAEILQPLMPGYTLQELESLAKEWAVRFRYNCICQAPPASGAVGSRLTQEHA